MLKVKTKDKTIYVPLGSRLICYGIIPGLKSCKYCGKEAGVKVYEYRKTRGDLKTGRKKSTISRTVYVGCDNTYCATLKNHVQISFTGERKDVRDGAIRRCIKRWEERN